VNPTTSIAATTTNTTSTQSITAYVYRSGTDKELLGIHDYFSYFIFEDEVTRTISIPTGSTSRNIMVEVPISELAADARSAIVTASYGTTSYRLETYTQDLGNSLKVFTVVMEDVPGNVNSITVKVESRTGTGDSFIVGGVNLRIQCGGNAPEALPDAAATTVNTAVAIDILANDIDLDNNLDIASLTNLGVLDPQNGSLSSFDATTGSVTYTPDAAFTGIDVFEYLLCDSTGICDIGQVTVTVTCAGGQFVNATNFYNLNLGGAKDGGLTWADFNNDGNIDVLVNTTNTTNDSRLYFADAAGLLTFTDVTTTNASGLLDNNCRRTAIAADLNNDGYVDFLRNYFDRIEIYYNKGPNSNPAYSFGTGTQDPNIVITAITGGMNTEGIGFIDWNSDGYLDIVVDNDNNGTEIYENDKDGTFTLQTPGTGAGQPDFPASIGDNGDYMALADYNNDGHTDLIIRKDATDANGVDIWEYNPATSRYDGIASPNIAADGGNKGAITFCDLDNDADLDMIWTAGPGTANKIYENSGGTYTLQSTLLADAGIDECDCADVDNDGDLDIFFGDDAGTSYLYKNNGAFSFTQDNDCINPAADVEGSEFVDFDGDGDMDLYMNINGAANQLWVNSQNDQNFLKVEARESVGNGLYRAALGANIVLSECGGTDSLVQEVSGGRGHGSQKPSTVHFGLGSNGDSKAFNVVVYFPEVDGSIDTVIRTLVPNLYANQTISITRGDADNENCTDTDGDGVPDISDTDVDGDGVLNSAEYSEFTSPFADSDNDGVYDYLDSDFSACGGIVNGVCSAFDQDGDGLADFFDLDSDNDGTSDVLEAGGTDSNSDGIIDNNNSDTDGDGYPNSVDSDNGGTALADPDSDRDGVKNRVDLDSDNDGIMDIIEVGLTDSNGDGVSDVLTDTDGDGLANPYDSDNGGTAPTLPDTDSDGFKNYVDSDSDNDGIPDVIEAQTTAAYTAPAEADADGDGIDDSFDGGSGLVPVDTDSDGTPDYLDTDSDNDGYSDQNEAYDTDGDRITDTLESGDDTDGDGIDDSYDVDAGATDNGKADNNQTPASFPNDDNASTSERDWRAAADWDNDGISDLFDIDDDNDGILDSEEGEGSIVSLGGFENITGLSFGNNIGTSISPWQTVGTTNVINVDGTGGSTYGIGGPEFDARGGAGNYYDIVGSGIIYQTFTLTSAAVVSYSGYFSARDNSSGDGAITIHAGVSDTGAVLSTTDTLTTNNNTSWTFLSNSVTLAAGTYSFVVYLENFINFDEGGLILDTDADGDGIFDRFDLDSDNDGIADIVEAGGVDTDGDGKVDAFSDTDGDGYANTFDQDNGGTPLENPDTDADGVIDAVDRDSDNDGLSDLVESGGTDSNNDGISDNLTDTDGDGFVDTYDTDDGGSNLANADADSDGRANRADIDSDGDGIVDLIELQTTAAYVGLSGVDTDEDGIDDQFDSDCSPCGGITRVTLTPTNTDGADNPDYLDTDSDNDGVSDNIEAYDLNYDDVVDNVASGTDSDGDGLDNTYDSDAASTTNAGGSSNNSQTAASFPDTYPTTAERSWREERLPIKTGPGDVEVTSSCPVFSGSDWIDVTGGSGNIVYSINPNGNNLGATCWGLRMLSGSASVRKDTNNAFPEYILNRNFYLEPTTQPTSNVDIKFYVLKTEVADLRTALATDGYGNGASEQAFVDDSLKITESKPATINLDPLDNAGASANQLNPENTSFTADGYALSVRAGELGEFIPGMVPNLPNAALPIQLLDFWLEKGERKLWAKWRVASEKNVLNYEIERSTDLNSWKSVGTVDAQGQNNGQMEYSLLDEQVLFGTSYYRLMSHEFDGRTVIEGIRSVDFEQSGKLAVIYPNPTRSSIFIDLNQIKGNTAVQIFNVAGALVYDSEISGSELHAIELNLPAGSYHVELTHPGGRQSERLIITN